LSCGRRRLERSAAFGWARCKSGWWSRWTGRSLCFKRRLTLTLAPFARPAGKSGWWSGRTGCRRGFEGRLALTSASFARRFGKSWLWSRRASTWRRFKWRLSLGALSTFARPGDKARRRTLDCLLWARGSSASFGCTGFETARSLLRCNGFALANFRRRATWPLASPTAGLSEFSI
jgi:hypothetical protein